MHALGAQAEETPDGGGLTGGFARNLAAARIEERHGGHT
jgi:hypothetical protein